MDNIRLVLLFTLAFVLLLIYQAWMKDFGPAPKMADSAPVAQTIQSASPEVQSVPNVDVAVDKPASSTVTDETASPADNGEIITVETDFIKAEISTLGGTLERLWLLKYPVSPDTPEDKVQLLKPVEPNLYLAQSGLIGSSADAVPSHKALYRVKQKEFHLTGDQRQLTVELTWDAGSGVEVKKVYLFKKSSYLIEVKHEVTNGSGEELAARSYYQLMHSEPYDPNESSFVSSRTYTGAAFYSPEEKFKKVSFKDITETKLDQDVTGGWISILQHYFVSAWIPNSEQLQHFYTNLLNGPHYVIGGYTPTVSIAPDSSHTFSDRLYIGPKLQDHLASIAPGLELTVDYGWLTVLAQPIWWLLNMLHSLVHNWGWAIILLTILIKAAFYKLSETSYKSMANMRKLTPRLQALKDRYGDDKEKLNQAMMDLYKKEKVNPLGGCLPILIQIPVFIALYWVLLDSVEMRQAPFALWIDNLSAPDSYYILPLIMGVSMLIQQKLNPAPVDPIQAKLMMSLPIVFTVFFAFFPSGLVLYWTVNNLLSITQQWHITRKIEAGSKQN